MHLISHLWLRMALNFVIYITMVTGNMHGLPCLTDSVGLAPPVYVDQGNGIRGLLWACLDKRCARHSKRNRAWSDDLHASTRSWCFQGQWLPWMGNKKWFLLVLLWYRCELIVNFELIDLRIEVQGVFLQFVSILTSFIRGFAFSYGSFPAEQVDLVFYSFISLVKVPC